MPAFTCYVAGYNNTDSLDDIGQLTLGPNTAGSFIRQFSNSQLDVAFNWDRWGLFKDNPIDLNGVGISDLPDALSQLLGTGAPSDPPSLGLLICNQLAQAPQQYGVMFDEDEEAGSIGPRQGFALFIAAIKAGFQQAPSPADLAEFVAYTAVHELGHAFNLWHMEDTSFMQPHPVPTNPRPYVFNSTHAHYLSQAAQPEDADYVLPGPGRKPYGTLAPGFHADDNSPFAGPADIYSGLSLRIALTHAQFWSFEPVELDLELTATDPTAAPVAVPDEIDPGYPALQIWITRPDGERFRFRSHAKFCQRNGERLIEPGTPYRRDIALFRQAGSYTFAMPGAYQVQVSFRLAPQRFVMSNVVTCEVLPAAPDSARWSSARALLQHRQMRRLLRFKRHLPSYQDCARLAQFADDAASPMTAAATHYALGKALIHASAGVTQQDYADDMRRRGAGHLRQALDAAILTPHRAGVATALLGA